MRSDMLVIWKSAVQHHYFSPVYFVVLTWPMSGPIPKYTICDIAVSSCHVGGNELVFDSIAQDKSYVSKKNSCFMQFLHRGHSNNNEYILCENIAHILVDFDFLGKNKRFYAETWREYATRIYSGNITMFDILDISW